MNAVRRGFGPKKLLLVGLVLLAPASLRAQDLDAWGDQARYYTQVSVELAKQLDKVKSQYQYDQLVKNIPTGNLGFFLMYQFRNAPVSKTDRSRGWLDAPNRVGMSNQTALDLPTIPESGETVPAPAPTPFLDHLAVQAGLELIGKGGKIDDGGVSQKLSLWYLEVPVHALYLHPLPNKKLLFGGLGPYLAYGLSGTVKSGGTPTINAFDKTNGLRRFDAGLSLTAGCWLTNRIVASLRYDLGLANLSRDPQYEKIRNRSIGLEVGYALGVRKAGK
jgi:hypothetical protein